MTENQRQYQEERKRNAWARRNMDIVRALMNDEELLQKARKRIKAR